MGNEHLQILRILSLDGVILAFYDFNEKLVHAFRLKRLLQSTQLIQHNSDGPNIRFKVVRLVVNYFRRKVIWRSDFSHRLVQRPVKYPGYAEVS